jgi:hypothetical protein
MASIIHHYDHDEKRDARKNGRPSLGWMSIVLMCIIHAELRSNGLFRPKAVHVYVHDHDDDNGHVKRTR